MSDLQILLISIGVVIIVLVVLYNAWQDWRARRSLRRLAPQAEQDVLMQGAVARREPGLWTPGGAATAAASPVEDAADIDAACEAVIDIGFAHPVPGEALASGLQAITRAGAKPVRAFVQREAGGHVMRPRPGESYAALQLAVVLANRSGPLTAIEWSGLWTQAQALADQFEGTVEAPEQDVVLRRAAELDTRCAAMDAQVGLQLQLAAPRTAQAVADAAAEAGFVQVQGQWVWLAENGLPRFVLHWDAQTAAHRVDLVLDVPNSLPDDQAFSRMVAVARDLAVRLDAHVLDDQGRTFQDSSAASIDGQISHLYDQLDQAGFLAGTERAARVFS